MYCARFERVVLGQIPPRITGIKVRQFSRSWSIKLFMHES